MQLLLARHLSKPLRRRPLRRISQKMSTFSCHLLRANCEPHQTTSHTIYPCVWLRNYLLDTQVLIQRRANKDNLTLVKKYSALIFFYLSFDKPDSVTANAQAATMLPSSGK